MHLHPPWMVFWRWCLRVSHCLHLSLLNLLVAPNPVRPHIRAIEVGFIGTENHAVDGRLFAVLVVLDILLDVTGGIDGEDVSVARVVVERVAIHVVRRFLGG
jgi:hypothetical protein